MPQALERQEGLDVADRPGVRGDQVDEAARADNRRVGAELAADRLDDPVDLTGEAVDEPRLQRAGGRLADHLRRLDVVDLDEPCRAREERVHRDLDPGSEDAADVAPVGETTSKFVEVPKSATIAGAP